MSILTLEVVEPFTVKEHGQVSVWQVGQRLVLSPEKAQRVIDRVGTRVRVVEPEAMDSLIGTVVHASMDFQNTLGERVRGVGPWIVADVVAVEHAPDLVPGHWLLLLHGPNWRWSHASTTSPYRCPACTGSRCWWSVDTVLCVTCIPPSLPHWRALWREVADLTSGMLADDLRYPLLQEALQQCTDGFKAGDYAGFQAGVIRVRRAAQGVSGLTR